jgi:hypothetical protein
VVLPGRPRPAIGDRATVVAELSESPAWKTGGRHVVAWWTRQLFALFQQTYAIIFVMGAACRIKDLGYGCAESWGTYAGICARSGGRTPSFSWRWRPAGSEVLAHASAESWGAYAISFVALAAWRVVVEGGHGALGRHAGIGSRFADRLGNRITAYGCADVLGTGAPRCRVRVRRGVGYGCAEVSGTGAPRCRVRVRRGVGYGTREASDRVAFRGRLARPCKAGIR